MTTAVLSARTTTRAPGFTIVPSLVAAAILGVAGVGLIGFALGLPLAVAQAEAGALAVSSRELEAARGLAALWPVIAATALLHLLGAAGAIDGRPAGKVAAVAAAALSGSAVLIGLTSVSPTTESAAFVPAAAAYAVAALAAVAIPAPPPMEIDDSRMAW